MTRRKRALAIPLDELREHLSTNDRLDVKVIVAAIMTDELHAFLTRRGRSPVKEALLDSNRWRHTTGQEANLVVEARELVHESLPQYTSGPITVSFAIADTPQEEHYHLRHIEIYFSTSAMRARYRPLEDAQEADPFDLPDGGMVIFGTQVVHLVDLQGETFIVEAPALEDDKRDDQQVEGKT